MSITVWFRHWYNGHFKVQGVWCQTVREFKESQRDEAKQFGKTLKDQGHDVKGWIGSYVGDFSGEKTIRIAVRANDDGTNIKELVHSVPFRGQLFKRPISSRVTWGLASLVTFGVAYVFSTVPDSTDTVIVLARSMAPVAWLVGGLGFILFTVLGLDKEEQ